MFWDFLKRIISSLFTLGAAYLFFFFSLTVFLDKQLIPIAFGITSLIYSIHAIYMTYMKGLKCVQNESRTQINALNKKLQSSENQTKNLISENKKAIWKIKHEAEMEIAKSQKNADESEKISKSEKEKSELYKQSLIEATTAFPSLIEAIKLFEEYKDNQIYRKLKNKARPAKRAAEEVKEQTRLRREADQRERQKQFIIEYYEYNAPFLVDLKDEFLQRPSISEDNSYFEYTEEERKDPISKFISPEKYRILSVVERNQLALDRYIERYKSNAHIGRIYERYIGYIFESDGYEVEYHGIKRGVEDLGIDLICNKGNSTILIQCKNWSRFKTIHENQIFQFFGTVYKYKQEHSGRNIRAMFYCTTKVSDLSRQFATDLGIELKENYHLDKHYPCIKCNVSGATGEKNLSSSI